MKIPLRPLAAAWLLCVIACVLLALGRGIRFDSSILALLPESEQQPLVRLASERIGEEFSSRLLIMLSGDDEAAVRDAVSTMAASLEQLPQVENLTWRIDPGQLDNFRDELFPYRFVLLDGGVRQSLLEGNFERLGKQALLRLFGPLSAGAASIVDDPFGLYFELQKNRAGLLNLEVANSLLKAAGAERPTYLLTLELAGDPFAPALQAAVLSQIEDQRQDFGAAIAIRMSGMLIHAAAGAKQAETEISTIGLGSLLGIVIAVLAIFRRARPLMLMLVPVAIGCIFATAATLLIFGRIHLITLAFGAGLVGVSIDYALHFLTERRYSGAGEVIPKIIGGLLLGLFSSLMAYAVMILTPFPGLRQMAAFSVSGLVAAWLTVVLWLPGLTRADQAAPIGFAHKLACWRQVFPRIETSRWLQSGLALGLAAALWVVATSSGRDDVRLLRTSPPELMAQEQAVQRTLGNVSSSQYLLVSADNLQQNLQLEEKLAPALDSLVDSGLIQGYQALSAHLPSLERQAQNQALVEKLYRAQLENFYQTLKLPEQRLRQARQQMLDSADRRLTVEDWRGMQSSEALQGFIVDTPGEESLTVIRFRGVLDEKAKTEIAGLADSIPGLYFVDQLQSVSQLLKKYRAQISKWLIIAYLAVFLVLALRYQRELWRVVLPPLVASILTLAILVQIEQGINLFHLMALILVLGIGLDMGIFLAETGQARQTWLAVSLSSWTSLLAFGLLALSRTPVLHHFGITVAIGLSLVWLLSPTVRGEPTGEAT